MIVSALWSVVFGFIWIAVFIIVAMIPEWSHKIQTDNFMHDVAHVWGWLWMSAGFTAAIFLDSIIDRTLAHIHGNNHHVINFRSFLGGLRIISLLVLLSLAICIGILVIYHGDNKDWIDEIEKVVWWHIAAGVITKGLWLYQSPYQLQRVG